jgi:hypothetical protein
MVLVMDASVHAVRSIRIVTRLRQFLSTVPITMISAFQAHQMNPFAGCAMKSLATENSYKFNLE